MADNISLNDFIKAAKDHPANQDLSESQIEKRARQYWANIDFCMTDSPEKEVEWAIGNTNHFNTDVLG